MKKNCFIFIVIMAFMAISLLSENLFSASPSGQPVKGAFLLNKNSLSTLPVKTETEWGTIERLEKKEKLKTTTVSEVIRVTTKKLPNNSWDFQKGFLIQSALKKGEVLYLHFYARTIKAVNEQNEGRFYVVFEEAHPPYDKTLRRALTIPGEWKEFCIPFRAHKNFAAKESQLNLQFGQDIQELELAGLELQTFGSDYNMSQLPRTKANYPGQDLQAEWRTEAQKRIETVRKVDLEITIVDKEGKKRPDVKIELKMKKHDFSWGSAIQARMLEEQSPDAERYRAIIEKNFNRVVFENDLKWVGWNNLRGRQSTLRAIQWLRDRKIEIRGHCLVWPSWRYLPREMALLQDQSEKLREKVYQHIREEVGQTKGKITEWDVINEPYSNHDLMDILGNQEMVQWFKIANKTDSAPRLFLNDYSILSGGGRDIRHQDHFEKTLKYLLEQGAPLGGIGMQGHFGEDLTNPEKMIKILDRFAALDLPIVVTEFDVNTDDEALQADFTRDFLITMFSHPAVDGLLTWGFWEPCHWRPQAAFYRKDWSLRPAGQVWLDLVRKKWWTNESQITNQNGQALFHPFYGEYELILSSKTKTETHSLLLKKDKKDFSVPSQRKKITKSILFGN